MNIKQNELRQKEFVSLSKQRGNKSEGSTLMTEGDMRDRRRWTGVLRAGSAGDGEGRVLKTDI
jgi:hypothetical protein